MLTMKKIINVGLVIALLLYATSCGQDFLDVNTDPNNPGDATVELVFPAAVTSTASVVGGDYAILGGIWSQYWTQNNGSNQYKTLDAFQIEPTTLNARFTELYAGALNDYIFVKNKALPTKNWSFYLMSTVMEAYTFQVLVDLYDQIPFTEALQGNNKLAPAYTAGAEVYDSLIARIDFALAQDFNNIENGVLTAKNPGNSDFVFGGDMDKWKQFANTLKLKMYLRQIYARPQVAQAGIQALYASGASFLTEDAAMTGFEDATSKRNPLFEQDQSPALNTNQNLKASTTLFSFLQTKADPRLDALYVPGTSGQKSLDQGSFNTPSTVIVPTTISRALISPTAPVYFISKAESYFLQAEAVLRGLGTGDVKALYDAGVAASFEQLELDGTTFYATGGAYEFPAASTTEEQLEAIIVQKWASMAGTTQGLEAFFERNRTGYPRVSPVEAADDAYVAGQFTYPLEGVTGGQFPKRLLFPVIYR